MSSDADLVDRAYEACWLQSRGRYNKWVDGCLDPISRRFYVAMNAITRGMNGGITDLLHEVRFELEESISALESFGLFSEAKAVRELKQLSAHLVLSKDQRQRDLQIADVEISEADLRRLNKPFVVDEQDRIYRCLAEVVQSHPKSFDFPGR
ncbi:MAG TPA: hypothetical protein VGB55_12175 [Tepidisphaeraceae bacterium]|jgi:hypothetical protein